jgi:hypothetical protein
VPYYLGELEGDCIRNLSLVPKMLAIYLKFSFVVLECLIPEEARGTHAGT